jgi:nucleoid-associated protein YgaU
VASTEGAAGMAAGSPATASPGQASSGQPAGETAAADASDTAPPATPGETQLSVAAAEAEGSSVYVAGQAEPGSSVRVFANEDLLGEAQVNASGNWMLEAQGEIPVGRVEIRADQTAGQNVVARTMTPFVRYPGYTPLIPNADTAAGLPASLDAATEIPIPANVIIRSGDNLWTISRRTYGHGIRYKSIYSANSDLIRNPDLIYPGQVFLLPTQRPGGGAAEAPLTQ